MENAVQHDNLRALVRDTYGKISERDGAKATDCCGPAATPSCCGGSIGTASDILGYSESEIRAVPEGADLGLGCGNPVALASLKPGEVVVDLGSGAGFDCFLAAPKVGATGRIIGVDMTPEMISKSRKNAAKGKFANVEFRLGEIEHLPIADHFADIIISNCVINLSPDKRSVINEAFRVLKYGGRLAISDIVATKPLPEDLRNDPELLCGCMAGATLIEDLRGFLSEAGFINIQITEKPGSRDFIRDWAPNRGVENFLISAAIHARKQ